MSLFAARAVLQVRISRGLVLRNVLQRATSSLTRPFELPRAKDWKLPHESRYAALPTEEQVLRHFYRSAANPDPAWLTPTGIAPSALAAIAGAALDTDEVPEVTLADLGSCNAVYALHCARGGPRTVAARIPLLGRRHLVRVAPAVASMSYARHVLHMADVVPAVFAWDASSDNALGAPYTLQEFAPADCIEGWQVIQQVDGPAALLPDLARWHAALAQPLAPHLSAGAGVGELAFAPSATDPTDPASYVLRPLALRGRYRWDTDEPVGTFHATSTSLSEVWAQRWAEEAEAARADPLRTFSCADADELRDEGVTPETFTRVAEAVRVLCARAQAVLAQRPAHARATLVNLDYALRNVLADPHSLTVRALIDWDDVYVLPFALSAAFPDDLTEASQSWAPKVESDWPPAAAWLRDGGFDAFPLSLYGKLPEINPGTPGAMEANDRSGVIIETAQRDTYLAALRACDPRFDFADPDLDDTRRHVHKAQFLLKWGAPVWWGRREWLDSRAMVDPSEATSDKN